MFLRMVSPYLECWKRFWEIKIQLMFPFLDVSIQSSLISLEFSVNCDISSKMIILCWSGFKPISYMLGIPSCKMISGHAKMKKKLVTWAWRKVLDALKTNSYVWKLWYSFFLTYFTFFVIIDHFFKKVTLIFWQTQIDHLCRLSEIFFFEQGLYPHAFARTTKAIHKLHYAGFWLNQNYKKVLRLKIKSCHG